MTLHTPTAAEVVGRLVAVNVGLPRDVAWRGRTVHTGVWKRPVDGPRQVGRLNLEGDGQGDLAGHGGPHRAVLVYQRAAYEHWREHFGWTEVEPGMFGENFTVDGLPDDETCVGDRYRIGDALFQVSQPRVTCYRVGLRLGEPTLPALLVAHHRPGFYLRVLEEGTVQAGDDIRLVGRDPAAMTVAAVDALLYLPDRDRADVARALDIAALSPGWQESFRAIMEAGEGSTGNVGLSETAGERPAAWPGFRAVRVADVVTETATVKSFLLVAPEGQALPPAAAGQFVAVRMPANDGRPPPVRSYSLSGPPTGSSYRISVKREQPGTVSDLVHTRVRPGDTVEISAPRGRFTLDDREGPVLLVSAGIGVTPVLAMLHELSDSASVRAVWWLHGARNSSEHAFAAETRALLAGLPHARRLVCYSRPLASDVRGVDYDHIGRLDAHSLTAQALPPDGDAYVCGPDPFMGQVRQALLDLGFAAGQVHTEVFGSASAITPGIAAGPVVAPHPPAGEPGDGPAVTFARSGLTVRWPHDVGNVLELAEACDVPTRWSCRTGVCHTCETGLMAGTVSYDPEPVDQPAPGNVLVCCAAPKADLVLDL